MTGLNQKLGIENELFCLADEIVLTVLGRVSFMPVLVLAARVCPEGVEATLFATLMSILNGGSVSGGFLGSGLTKVRSCLGACPGLLFHKKVLSPLKYCAHCTCSLHGADVKVC